MDLKTRGVPPTVDERAAVDSVLGPAPERELHDRRGGHADRARRHLLLPTLHAINDRVGWISQEAIDYAAERLDISPAEIHGVASFYALFSLVERPAHQVHVCVDLACRAYELSKDGLNAQLKQHNPIDRLAPLAKAKVPIFHIHGDSDRVVPLKDNSGEVAKRLRALGCEMQLVIPKGQGHNMWKGFFQCQELVDFVIAKSGAKK